MQRRQTPSKEEVLNVLSRSKKALSQEDIEKKVKVTMDRVTIYRVLNRFCEDGIVHKIVADDGKQYFALCHNCEEKKLAGNHFHFRCLSCDTIECLAQKVKYTAPKGYSVESANCLLTGYCAKCA